MPREKRLKEDRDESGLLVTSMEWVIEKLKTCMEAIARWTKKIGDWLDKLLPKTSPHKEASETSGISFVQGLLYVLLTVLTCVLAILFWRARQKRKKSKNPVVSEPISTVPDLMDDEVVADELPSNRWLVLARELTDKGAFRQALRALYLATLAHLGEHEMINIAKYKSNRDYERELGRRAHGHANLLSLFSRTVKMFDRAWYGMHEVTREHVGVFAKNQERITAFVKG
jgi:hypothetical protein